MKNKKLIATLVVNNKKYSDYKISHTGNIYSNKTYKYLKIIRHSNSRYFKLEGNTVDLDIALMQSFYPKIVYLLNCGFYLIKDGDSVHNFFIVQLEEYVKLCKLNKINMKLSYFTKSFLRLLHEKENWSSKQISEKFNLTKDQVYRILHIDTRKYTVGIDMSDDRFTIGVICKQYVSIYNLQKITWKDLYNIIME